MKTYEKLGLASLYATEGDVLRELAKETNVDIRYRVGGHSNTPEDILWELAKAKEGFVRSGVAENPKTSSKILVTLFEYEKHLNKPNNYNIRAIYKHANLPTFAKRVIETLFGDIV